MDTQSLPIVSFGKYKDKSVLDLLEDVQYVEWLKLQSWFREKKEIYNIIVNQTIYTNTNSKTPEHNKLQNMFLDKENQQNLINKLISILDKNNYITKLKILFENEDFIKCFGNINLQTCIKKLFNTTVKFEDKFNWDLVLYRGNNSCSLTSIDEEYELGEKIKYRKEYDILEKQKYIDKITEYDDKIKIREKYDSIMIEKFKKDMQTYLENKELNERQVYQYEIKIKNYYEKKEEYKKSKLFEICREYKISVIYYNKCSSNEKRIIDNMLDEYMKEYELKNKSPVCVYKLKMPEMFDISKDVDNSNIPEEYKEKYTIQNSYGYKYFEFNSVRSFKYDKEKYIEDYDKYYEKNFEKHYETNRKSYYENMFNGFSPYVSLIDNKYIIRISQHIYKSGAICCELKPSLSEDYPCVLRKLKTQIELTKNDKTTFYTLHDKIWVLIIGEFNSTNTSREQLITIFNQSEIRIIFTDELFDIKLNTVQIINKIEKNILDKKLIDENIILSDSLKNTEEKLAIAEEKIKQLEAEILTLKTQKTNKSIKDYFGKK